MTPSAFAGEAAFDPSNYSTRTNAMEIEKLTTRYDENQDRICVDGQSTSGEVATLWLTNRLLLRLLPQLFEIVAPGAGVDHNAETVAAWELATARTRQKPQKAVLPPPAVRQPASARAGKRTVEPPPQPSGWLVQSINIKSSATRTLLVFRTASGEEASVAFTAEQLRQWLSIVHGQWRRAGWPLAVWPGWVKKAAVDTPRPSPATMVH